MLEKISSTCQYQILSQHEPEQLLHQFGLDVLMGLLEPRKRINSKYLYDTEGSQLYNEITRLSEYYLTDCELAIFAEHGDTLVEKIATKPFNLIELGPGEGQKTHALMQKLLATNADFQYIPIDISKSCIHNLTTHLNQLIPQLTISGIVAEYFQGLTWLRTTSQSHNVVFFLGSSIGNFNYAEIRVFLHSLWSVLNHNDLVLIGFDLRKDIDILEKAYNDKQGVTAKFNLNLLQRINNELGANFILDNFRHYAPYNVFSGAMESYLVSKKKQKVYIDAIKHAFTFQEWEPIHLEYSYKYLLSDIISLAADTGFTILQNFTDKNEYFADSLWQVEKSIHHTN